MLKNFVSLYAAKLLPYFHITTHRITNLSPLSASELSEGLYKQIHTVRKYFSLSKCSNCTSRLDFKASVDFKAAHGWVAKMRLYSISNQFAGSGHGNIQHAANYLFEPLSFKSSMMAASSFADGLFYESYVDLDYVNCRLQWNSYLRDRNATPLWWDVNIVSNSIKHFNFFKTLMIFAEHEVLQAVKLKHVKWCVKCFVRFLAHYHENRVLLDAENSEKYVMNLKYWHAKAAFYKTETQKFKKKNYNQRNRSITFSCYSVLFDMNESKNYDLNAVKIYVEIAAWRFARFSGSYSFLKT